MITTAEHFADEMNAARVVTGRSQDPAYLPVLLENLGLDTRTIVQRHCIGAHNVGDATSARITFIDGSTAERQPSGRWEVTE